jgi:hypothetical protein
MDIICDIDGTIADNKHRLYLCLNDPKDWEGYYALGDKDKPMLPMLNLVRALLFAQYRVVFSTGRPELSDQGIDVRLQTEMWLKMNLRADIDYTPILFMRPAHDHRPDFKIKAENLQKIRQSGYDPVMTLDDRERCLDMYKDQGIFCLRVGDVGAY